MNTKLFRNNSLMFSEEVIFYLKLEAKRMVRDTDASITLDQIANGICRKELTEYNPEWIVLWDEMQKAKQDAGKIYRAIEEKGAGWPVSARDSLESGVSVSKQ